jgi:hypothetical protein
LNPAVAEGLEENKGEEKKPVVVDPEAEARAEELLRR